ncbi:MAG: DUF433 domain-containing protein [Polyangiaceae bacterium]
MALPIVLVPHPHVRSDSNVLGGSPYVLGSRVPVRRLWAFYRSGASIERILKRYPQLGPAKVFDALAFAFDNEEVVTADMAREEDFLARAGQKSPRKSAASEQIELPFQSSPMAHAAPAPSSAVAPERPAARGPRARR